MIYIYYSFFKQQMFFCIIAAEYGAFINCQEKEEGLYKFAL